MSYPDLTTVSRDLYYHETAYVRALEQALIPFAEAARHAEPDEKDSYSLAGSSARHGLTLGDLFRAKAALAAKGNDQ